MICRLSKSLFLSTLAISLFVGQHVLLGLRFSELSWDHSYPEQEGDSHILWLEFDGEEDGTPVNKLLKIYSKQVRTRLTSAAQNTTDIEMGSTISDLLSRLACC